MHKRSKIYSTTNVSGSDWLHWPHSCTFKSICEQEFIYIICLTYAMQDSGNSSARKFLITSVGKKTSDVGSDLILPVQDLKNNPNRQRFHIRHCGRGNLLVSATPGVYLVFVKALIVLWSRDAVSVTPFVKVLREKAFQLEAADVVQLIFAG